MRLMSRAAFAVAAILFAAPALHAQTSFNAALGASIPIGDTGDGFNVGYHAIAGVGLKPPLAPLGVRIEGMFNQFGAKQADVSMRILAATVNGTLSGAGMPIPMGYLIGGVGMYNTRIDLPAPFGDASATDLGFNIGAGLNIPLTGFGTYIEARYHHIVADGGSIKFLPVTFGVKF